VVRSAGKKKRLANAADSNKPDFLREDCALRTRWLPLVTLLGVTCSCSDDPDGVRYSVRDSAGIQVVENRVPAWGADSAWRIDPEPSLDLGGPRSPPELYFQQLSDFGVLPNGNFAAADMTTRQVYFISSTGDLLAIKGGRGKGPGEFDALSGVAVLGERVFAYDPHSARLTVYDSVGEFLEATTLEQPENTPPLYTYHLAGITGGHPLLSPRMFTPSPNGNVSTYRDSAPNLLFSVDGRFQGEVAEPSGVDMFVSVQGASSVPFSVISLIAPAGDRVLMSHGKDFEVRAFRGRDVPSQIFRRSYSRRPVTEDDLQQAIADHLSMAGASSARDPRFEGFRRMMESAPLPEEMPSIGQLLVDALGYSWCQHYRRAHEPGPTTWSVFSPQGDWLGELKMPTGFWPGLIGSDYLLGVYTDSLDVQHIWRLPLNRDPGAA
jgi:hypothetical protein